MSVQIEESWNKVLSEEFNKPEFKQLTQFIRKEYSQHTVYPEGKDIFNAFNSCPFDQVKVVILGQDPYHGAGQAHGLSFSVKEGVRLPPSLRNIYKEIESDLEKKMPESGNLERWAQQGVLLLNATLTVREGDPGSHQKMGWEGFTDAVIKKISDEKENVVFMLWGSYAQKKGAVIDEDKHFILTSVHPSPLSASRGFFGSKHFSKCNKFLILSDQEPIDW